MEIKGKGTLYQTSDETWVGRFSLGPDPARPGKYLYSPRRTFHCKEEWEARKEFEAYRRELEENGIPEKDLAYLGNYAERWFELRKGSHKSVRTAEREALDVRHIIELFPKVRIKNLTPIMIKTTYEDARARGRFDKEIYQINKRLRQILDEAVEDGFIAKNPARKVSIRQPDPEPKDYLDPERLEEFNRVLFAQRLCGEIVGAHMLLRTGMRPGEMYGASWENMNFCTCRIFIGKQYTNDLVLRDPKSNASQDWIALDSTLIATLLAWKIEQKERLSKLGIEQTPKTPIASNSFGGRFDPTNYGRWFRNFCVDNGFGKYSIVQKTFIKDGKLVERGKGYKGLCPNMFRDIQATMLLGYTFTDVKTLKNRLRHSEETTSLKYYTHPIEENDYKAALAFDGLLSGHCER